VVLSGGFAGNGHASSSLVIGIETCSTVNHEHFAGSASAVGPE
jgi:hypothetical protein